MRVKYTKQTVPLIIGFVTLLVLTIVNTEFDLNLTKKSVRGSLFTKPFDLSEVEPFQPLQFTSSLFKSVANGQFPVKLTTLQLDIKFKELEKILSDRKLAIKNDILHNARTVPAKVSFQGSKYKAKVRLKGDLQGHWSGPDRWSFRIRLTGNNHIKGMSQFSLQAPKQRQFPDDQLFQFWVRQLGNLSPDFQLVRVIVNGDYWGIMLMEEHVGKSLLEGNKRKESPIFKFGSEDSWVYNRVNSEVNDRPQFFYNNVATKIYQEKKYRDDSRMRHLYSYAIERMRIFIASNETALDIIDQKAFSTSLFSALAWNSSHTLGPSNSRYYINPYTLLVEPITTDQEVMTRHGDGNKSSMTKKEGLVLPYLYRQLVRNQPFKELYDSTLFDLQGSQSSLKNEYDRLCKIFPIDCPEFNFDILENNIDWLKAKGGKWFFESHLKNPDDIAVYDPNRKGSKALRIPDNDALIIYPRHIYAEHYEDGRIRIYNVLNRPIQIDHIELECTKRAQKNCRDLELLPTPYQLAGSENGNIYFEEIGIEPGALDNEKRIKIKTSRGTESNKFIVSISLASGFYNPMVDGISVEKITPRPKWLSVDDNVVRIKKGTWQVNEPILFPKEFGLEIAAGTVLKFKPNAYFLVRGPILADGTADEPIIFDSIDNGGWKGIYVIKSGSLSRLSNVVFKDTDFFSDGILQLSGAVNFYEADVQLEHVKFIGSRAEDALNIVRSKFKINNTIFDGARSDAFDSDFSEGSINDTQFLNSKGDGLDTSGSKVVANNLTFQNITDKAISAGEASHLVLNKISATSIGSGIVSKDGSKVLVDSINVNNYSLYGAAVFMKKPIYGPAQLSITSSNLNKTDVFNQANNVLVLEGGDIIGRELDVKKLYETGPMKKVQ